jgi:DNA-binding response OmpR family regulator
MDQSSRDPTSLLLLIDEDTITRNVLRPVVRTYGLEIVQARASIAALELLQRVAERFRMVVVSLEMPGLSGAVLLETFRIFLPGLATVCLTAGSTVGGGGGCLAKPPRSGELRTRIAEILAGEPMPASIAAAAPDVVARARSAFALSASLLDAARGMPGESAIAS